MVCCSHLSGCILWCWGSLVSLKFPIVLCYRRHDQGTVVFTAVPVLLCWLNFNSLSQLRYSLTWWAQNRLNVILWVKLDSPMHTGSTWDRKSTRPWINTMDGQSRLSVRRLSQLYLGFLCGSAGKELACNVGDLGGKIPWRRERLPTPVFSPEEFLGLYSPWGCKQSDTTERLSLFTALF